jgi:FSR family fosmidomycin resistance protein-like MFS transporter
MISRLAARLGLHPTILLMASAHMMVDGYGNVYAPLLPLLLPKLGMSLATAGTLTMLYQLSASVAQIGFGHMADRWRPRVFIMAGPVIAVCILSLTGLSSSIGMLAAVLTVGGLGGAAFHPPAAALAHRLGGERQGFAMAVYISGGSVGFALGPLLFGPFAQHVTLGWTPVLALPGLAVVALFLARVPEIEHQSTPHGGLTNLWPYRKPLGLLYTIVVLRTLTSLAIATFLPVMLTRRGLSLSQASIATTIYLFCSGVGGFSGGTAADRYGPRRVIALSLVLACPFLFVSTMLTGWMFVVALSVGGFFLQSTLPVNVTFGQSLAPISAATVSSLMMGFGWGTAGLSVPLVGMLADRIGIDQTLAGLALVPLLAAACALPLPARAPLTNPAPAAAVIVAEPES